jgi:23S rRNA (uracil1939-C5)-methyltransferase
MEKGEVSGIAFGGEGIVRHNDLVVFVPFTAPGDEIIYQITERKKNFAKGQLVEILQKSSARVSPPCPYFGQCGGCQLQHLNDLTQLEYKRKSVSDALQRIAKLDTSVSPVIPATQQWAYRRHIHLRLQSHKDFYKAGYIALDNVSLIPVQECQIFIEKNHPLLEELQQVLRQLKNEGIKEEKGKITILKQLNNRYLFQFHFSQLPNNFQSVMENALSQHPHWQGVLASSKDKQLSLGKTQVTLEIENLQFEFSPNAFIQNHPEQSLRIYRAILEIAKSRARTAILDLFCGVGISSIMIAQAEISVRGIELNPKAIESAKNNAHMNQVKKASFQCADVKDVLKESLSQFKPELVIANPPREGLEKEVIQALLEDPVQEIIYISCMPPTLARDLKLLSSQYTIVFCQPYDMFPQTGHVETLVYLKQKSLSTS